MADKKREGVGVVIGRFQVPWLHEGHKQILRYAKRHQKLAILIGIHPQINTRADPLDYQTRHHMLWSELSEPTSPHNIILPLPDQPTDELWSKNLDTILKSVFPTDKPFLYGGRDSFIPHYHGVNETIEVDMLDVDGSGTDLRGSVSKHVMYDDSFRRGVIYGAYATRPRVNLCVDMAVTRNAEGQVQVLLGQKPYEKDVWRFPGGFVDPLTDECALRAAQRELHEETKLVFERCRWEVVSCRRVPDWRDAEESVIFSTLYHVEYDFGMAEASDDLARTKWFNLREIERGNTNLTAGHVALANDLIGHLRKTGRYI